MDTILSSINLCHKICKKKKNCVTRTKKIKIAGRNSSVCTRQQEKFFVYLYALYVLVSVFVFCNFTNDNILHNVSFFLFNTHDI